MNNTNGKQSNLLEVDKYSIVAFEICKLVSFEYSTTLNFEGLELNVGGGGAELFCQFFKIGVKIK